MAKAPVKEVTTRVITEAQASPTISTIFTPKGVHDTTAGKEGEIQEAAEVKLKAKVTVDVTGPQTSHLFQVHIPMEEVKVVGY